jgi:hypothetical protein
LQIVDRYFGYLDALDPKIAAIFCFIEPRLFAHRRRSSPPHNERKTVGSNLGDRFYVTGGGLMSYGIDLADTLRGAAAYVDHILRGAKPEQLPVQQPTKFKLVINLRTAKALGLTIPPGILAIADEVIEQQHLLPRCRMSPVGT